MSKIMNEWEQNFNKQIKFVLIYTPIFFGTIVFFGSFHLFEKFNKLITLIFFILLVILNILILSRAFKSHQKQNNEVEKQIDKAKIMIPLDIATHPLFKLAIYNIVSFGKKLTYYICDDCIIAYTKTLNSTSYSLISWDDILPNFIRMEFNNKYLAVILYRKFLNNKETPFNPVIDMNFNPAPENIIIPVNNQVEANRVMDFVKYQISKTENNNIFYTSGV